MESIIVVDDHPEARGLMSRILSETFHGAHIDESSTIGFANQLLSEKAYDLAVLDLSLPDGKGETLIRSIRAANPDCHIVIWSMHDRSPRLISVLAEGATGYLVKDQDEAAIRQAFARLPFGEPALSSSVTRRVLEHLYETGNPSLSRTNKYTVDDTENRAPDIERLTPRELEILQLLARGLNRPDIAGMLNISKSTVATHSANIYAKLQAKNRFEAVEKARHFGLL